MPMHEQILLWCKLNFKGPFRYMKFLLLLLLPLINHMVKKMYIANMINKLALGSFIFFVAYALVLSSPGSGSEDNNGPVPFSDLPIPFGNKPSGFPTKSQADEFGDPPNATRVKHIQKGKWENETFEMIAIIALLACIVIVKIIIFVVCMKRKKRQDTIKIRDSEMGLSLRASLSDEKDLFEESHCKTFKDRIFQNTLIERYSYEDLQKSTDDFSIYNLIEGTVYQGRLRGKVLAIKRVSSDIISRIDSSLFNKQNLHHPNIIALSGACATDGPDSFVVLEYAKNGSLKDWIFRGLALKSQFILSCNCFLTWDQRLRICLDVAVALKYMHCTTEPSYVHGNIRCRNIFLDEEFNAKVGNFGMRNCVVQHENGADEGYLAPECVTEGGPSSPAIDVFAYGVVLLEVLSGKHGIRLGGAASGGGSFVKVADEVKEILGSGNRDEVLMGWMDDALGESYSFDDALVLAKIGKSCVEDDALLRPSAGEIVEKLLKLL